MSSGLLDEILNSEAEMELGLEIQAGNIVQEHSNVLVDMNTDQLKQGRDSTGAHISPQYYSDDYAEMKNRMNPRPGFGVPDLFFEGDFQEGFFVEKTESGWEIDSRDEKRDRLASKYGKDIFGNTRTDEEEFNREYILPELAEWILKTLSEKL